MTDQECKTLESKYLRLQGILRDMGRVLVAFSGGVDSTLLLRVAQDVLSEGVLAVTAASEISPRRETEDAILLARAFGARHRIVQSRELELPEFVSNPADRCYLCKRHRFTTMLQLAHQEGHGVVAEGSNLDDEGDYRPGMRAVRELGVRSPLLEAGLSKAEIRFLSRELQLPTWNKPSCACLASRIPYGSPLTSEYLGQVDAAEDFIRGLGLCDQVRVRHYGDTARIEVSPEAVAKLIDASTRAQVVAYCKDLGFRFVTLDLEGYRMGSLNSQLATHNP